MKIQLPKNWKELAGISKVSYQRITEEEPKKTGKPQSLEQYLKEQDDKKKFQG